ncbi:MAG TPA: DUF4440 domain-containing protein [Panacibacter sp.]|nr:DUF4440 domain-containing protein [Panacibacter sp.]HNP45992.1 DUF4440 domain-containing protein [Panacibacter sp.]
MKSFLSSFAVAALLFTACNTATETKPVETTEAAVPATPVFNLDSVKGAIAASNELYGQSFSSGDSAMFIDRYTSDAMLMAPNMPAMSGTAGIAGFYKAALTQMGVKGISLTTTNVYGEGDYATEEGSYELFAAGGKAIDKGKFLVVWKKTDAGWKMYRDCFNSDNPPPPAGK